MVSHQRSSSRCPFVCLGLAALAAPVLAQNPAPHGPPGGSVDRDHEPASAVAFVPGTITDLAPAADGRVLYCTREREVGWFDPATSRRHVIAPAGSFPRELRAIAASPSDVVTVIDDQGDIYRLPNDSLPWVRVYDDLYLIQDVTDMIIDASGNHLIASRTPSTGTRGTNRVSADGQRWDYFIVRHQPVQLAADPLTDDILLADEEGGDTLWLVDSHDKTWPTRVFQADLGSPISAANDDGDMAVEANGDVYWIAGGNVWVRDRQSGTRTLFAGGFGPLRGVTIAPTSGLRFSPAGFSVYVAEAGSDSVIHELPGVGVPADPIAIDQGWVPGRGIQKAFLAGIQAFELTRDNDDNLLIGGSLYGANPQIRRIDTLTNAMTTIADSSHGLTGTIEGITVAPDDTIYAANRDGTIFRITENPTAVSTVYTDPMALVTAAKDLARDVNGIFYLATRNYWGNGNVISVSGGAGSVLLTTLEARGLSADPFSGGLYVTVWNCAGFCGYVSLYDFGDDTLITPPGFTGINYTNDSVWGDGDTVVDVQGNVYTCSEDDWSVVRYDPAADGIVRVGSGYLNHPSGIALARSSPALNSPTGWSLYISEYDFLWERPGFPPPAAAQVDSQASFQGVVVGLSHPKYGQPRDLVHVPSAGIFVTTSAGNLLRLDPETQETEPVAGAAEGLSGDLVGVDLRSDGRLVIASRAGDLFAVDPRTGSTELLHRDLGNVLNEVLGLAVDDHDRLLIVDRSGAGGLLVGYDGSRFVPLASATRGLRPAVDPLTGDFFVTRQGNAGTFGTLQRVRQRSLRSFTTPARASRPLAFEEDDGDLTFDDAGNLYLTAGAAGRIVRIDRRTGRQTTISGGHAAPVAAVIAGDSLFVLDGWTVVELRVP